MRYPLPLLAFILAFAGVCMAAFQNNFPGQPEPEPPEPPARSWKAVASDAAKKVVEEKILGKEPPPKPEPKKKPKDDFFGGMPLRPYQIIYTSLGLVAIGLGSYSWTRRIQTRLCGAAVAMGLTAVAWQWALLGVGLAIALLIIAKLNG
jgi:hypothetical protein